MKRRRSRWALVAIVAVALGTALMSLPSLAPLTFSSVASHSTVHSAGAPPSNASWQITLMAGRW